MFLLVTPARRVSYRGTEAQPNPPVHQGNWQPPHKTEKRSNRPINRKQKHTEVQVDKKSPHPHPTPTESSKSRRTTDASSFAHATHLTLLIIAQ